MNHRTIETLNTHQHIASTGDANLWLAPRPDHSPPATVMRFTTTKGVSIAVALSPAEVVRIRDDANNILAAQPADIDGWLDDAAVAVLGMVTR
jgi:hypothetical protein